MVRLRSPIIPLIVSFWFFLIAGLHGISLAEKIKEERSLSVPLADVAEEGQQLSSEDPVKQGFREKKEVSQWTVGGLLFLLGVIIFKFGGRRGGGVEDQSHSELRTR